MLKVFQKKIIVIAILVFVCLCSSVNAANDKSKLKGLIKQISKVKTDIAKKEKQQVSVKQQLKNLETKIKSLETSYRKIVKNLKDQKIVLKKLNNDQESQQLKLQKVQQEFSSQMMAAYQIERPNYLKMIFNKTSNLRPDILLAYHKYVFAARFEQMQGIKKILGRIASNKQKIKKETKVLEDLESRQQGQKQELIQTQRERNKILDSLENKIASQNKKLKQLISAKKSLEKLIARLSPHKAVAISSKLMAQLCRDFVWPTKGEVKIHFGSPIEKSSWRWGGVIISAPENQEIRAISSGKVVYADLFTGYGLLLIIDHGSGYMSLYGHNDSLIKQLEDEVQAGEVVSTVGRSGGEESRLYFAIRYNGKPVDPEKWCVAKL